MLVTLSLGLCVLSVIAPVGPERVAVVYSSGVDNDYRGISDCDSAFGELGWAVDKYRNTDLDALVARLEEYDLIYTTSLWNYGDPQDFTRWAGRLREWLSDGGCLVLTDMAYGSHMAVPPLLGEGLEVGCEVCKETVLRPTSGGHIFTRPNPVGGEPFWAHFTTWGPAYEVAAECGEGRPVLLTAVVGRGLLVVTTTWHHDASLVANIWAAAQGVRQGMVVVVEPPASPLLPGEGKVPVTMISYRDEKQSVRLSVSVTPAGAEGAPTLRQEENLSLSLGAKERRRVGVPFRLRCRGPVRVEATARTSEGAEARGEATFVVPPPLEVRIWGHHLLRGAWPAMDVTTYMPAGAAPLKVATYVDGVKVCEAPARRGPGFKVSLPTRKGPGRPGVHTFTFVLMEKGRPVASVERKVTVDERREPGSRVEVRGKQVLVNGRLFFPIGTYHVGPGDFQRLREHGFNCVTGPIYGGDQPTMTADQRAFFDAAEAAGLMVLSELSEYLRGGRRNFEGAANIASELVPHPALLCHYLVDEPYPAIGPEVVEAGFHAVQKADPFHPQLVCLNDPSSFGLYTKACHIYCCDPYPIPRAGGATSLKMVADFVDAMRAKWPTGPLWVAIQSHRNPPPVPDDSRWVWPSPAQVRCMSFLALNHGATGLLFYAFGDAYTDQEGRVRGSGFAYNAELFASYRELNPVLADLGPKYVTGLRPATSIAHGPDVDCALVVSGGQRLLIIVNPVAQERVASVDLAAAEATSLRPYTPFSPPLRGAAVSLPAFGVGVYELR